MPDLLDSLLRQLRQRLDELRPLVAEYERLRAADEALNPGGAPPARRRQRPSRPPKGRRVSTQAERQANRERMLAVLRERPGVTRAELKETTRLSTAGVAQHLRRLLDAGQIAEETLPGGGVGYRLRPDDRAQAATRSGGAQAATSG